MDVLMPQLGETVTEGRITLWYKSVGDAVAAGDNLFEIETEKVSMEVPAITAGVLTEIRVRVDETAPVGAVVAVISDGALAADASMPAAAAQSEPTRASSAAASDAIVQPAFSPAAQPQTARKLDPFFEVLTPERNYGSARVGAGIATTPLARRMAAEISVDLASVRGSGPEGRIVGKDVAALRSNAMRRQNSGAAGRSMPAEQVKALYERGSYVEQPIDSMRRVIARRLTQSKQTVPHFYLTVDMEIDALAALRERINAAASRQPGESAIKLSLNDLLVKAWALALKAVPAANAVWAEDRILRFACADVGIAIAVEGGLLTPVIRAADSKSLEQISSQVKDFAARARLRKLKPHEMQGGVSSISNLGMFGVREFSAIINPPQSTILAVGATQRRAIETEDGGVRFASLMTVTLSCDHRVVDGVLGADLLAALREVIRQPAPALG